MVITRTCPSLSLCACMLHCWSLLRQLPASYFFHTSPTSAQLSDDQRRQKKKKSPKIFQSSDCGLVRPKNSTKKKSSFRPEISATFFKSSESNGTITRPSDQHIHPVTGVPADPAGNNSTTAKISFFRPFNYDFTSLFAVSWMMCAQTGTFGAPGSIFNSGDGMHVTLCFS